MRKSYAIVLCLLLGCAGIKFPGIESRVGRLMLKSSHNTTNTGCIEVGQLNEIASYLEQKYLVFIANKNEASAIDIKEFKELLGAKCDRTIATLSTSQIQSELFGTSQNVPNPELLRELGGVEFEYENITTDSGLRPTFHLERVYTGPHRRLVAVYRLVDGKIIHLQYTGKDNVDKRKIEWPVMEFFGFTLKEGIRAF